VTNSDPRIVARRLASLACRGGEKVVVRGGAGKFSICASASADARFEALPEIVEWPEVGRPVLLRRGRYFDVLREIWDESATDPDSTLVVGDIFELDLAMPAMLGAHVHLLTRPSTMPHEERLARRLARGGVGPRLSAVLDRVRGPQG
jgi:hypothetical protein